MQDCLAVTGGFKSTFAEDRANIPVIVDLAIGDQEVIRLVNRLCPVFRPDDRQAAMRHDHRCPGKPRDLNCVRPAMGDLADHPVCKCFVTDIPEADKSANNSIP